MRLLVVLVGSLLFAGCLEAPREGTPASGGEPCHWTTLVGIIGEAGYNATWDPEGIRANLTDNGFTLDAPEFGVRGKDPWGRNFTFVESGTPRQRFHVRFEVNMTRDGIEATAEAAWRTHEAAFLESVNAFDNATSLRRDYHGWNPLITSGTGWCGENA